MQELEPEALEILELKQKAIGEYVYDYPKVSPITDEEREWYIKLGLLDENGRPLEPGLEDQLTTDGKIIVGYLDDMIEEVLARKQARAKVQ